MRKIVSAFFIIALLGGCAQLQKAENAVSIATTAIENPVTPERLYDLENGAIIVFSGLNAYKQLCINHTVPKSCRGVIQSIQVYTKQVAVALPQLRAFVKSNDQVNAVSVYNLITEAIANAKTVASQNNVKMGDV